MPPAVVGEWQASAVGAVALEAASLMAPIAIESPRAPTALARHSERGQMAEGTSLDHER